MATGPAGGSASTQPPAPHAAAESVPAVESVVMVESVDLRGHPAADGAAWAVFTFFSLFLIAGLYVCAVLVIARLRAVRTAAAAAHEGERPVEETRGHRDVEPAVA